MVSKRSEHVRGHNRHNRRWVRDAGVTSEGKTISEALPTPAAVRKAEQEIAEFPKFQELSRTFVELNEKICHLRQVEEDRPSGEEKKRLRRYNRKSRAK